MTDIPPSDATRDPGVGPRGNARFAAPAVLWAAVAWGSFSALGQCAKIFRRHYLNGEFAWAPRDVFWMMPLASWLYFVLAAFLVWGIGKLVRGRRLDVVVGGVLAGLCTLSVLMPFGGINEYAALVLAIGVGVQYARMLRADTASRRLPRVVHRIGVAAGLLLFIGGLIERATRDGRGLAPVVTAAVAGAPNVLVIIWDTVRAANLGLYGYGRNTTPELEQFAASATTYDWAMAPAPWTLPSHCSMFTGLHPGEHSCRWDVALGKHAPTLAELFHRRGYRTGAFVANRFYTSHETGLQRGFAVFRDWQVSPGQLLLLPSLAQMAIPRGLVEGEDWASRLAPIRRFALRGPPKPLMERKRATQVSDEFLSWQQDADGQPFFAFLNYFDAHDPYEPPEPFLTQFSADPEDRMARYDGGIAYLDADFGRLMRTLAERGILDRTIVVVASDHGEMFGEHGGVVSHGHALYLELMHVPLVIRYPAGAPRGVRVSRAAPLRDLGRTVVELAGLPDTLPGQNIASEAWRASPSPPDSLLPMVDRVALFETERTKQSWTNGPAARGALHGLLDDRWHYILYPDGREDLFAYRSDRSESRNLATTPHGQPLAARYRALLPTVARRLVQ